MWDIVDCEAEHESIVDDKCPLDTPDCVDDDDDGDKNWKMGGARSSGVGRDWRQSIMIHVGESSRIMVILTHTAIYYHLVTYQSMEQK